LRRMDGASPSRVVHETEVWPAAATIVTRWRHWQVPDNYNARQSLSDALLAAWCRQGFGGFTANIRERTTMKRSGFITLIAGALVLMSGCATTTSDHAVQMRNKAMAQRVFDEILNKQRYELFEEMYARDFVKHVDGRDYTLAQEIEDAKGMYTMSSDLVMTVDMIIAEGDTVATRYTGRGTSTGPISGMPATGNRYVLSGMTVYRFAEGRIVEEWTCYNELELLRQLGYAESGT